ncbi:hypothetical protein M514_04888 [Trichuris suis]|uniref:Uncharacterized protein n=1 Tax=Trichuris suis TaxID=68888 RepID=A0A085NP72_9BILA|nr:hypothetical protein M513_04888 [Trichuris suis]KFD71268.1 hypothetical protein M514_04888 [Trichuris suis]
MLGCGNLGQLHCLPETSTDELQKLSQEATERSKVANLRTYNRDCSQSIAGIMHIGVRNQYSLACEEALEQ